MKDKEIIEQNNVRLNDNNIDLEDLLNAVANLPELKEEEWYSKEEEIWTQ